MKSIKPKITVLMSVFNGIPYLREAVESILEQTYSEFEFIIIDDASTDATWLLLSEFAARDKRIILYKNEQNLGLTKSLNKGISLAGGEYIARQDADDVSLPTRFIKQMHCLDENPDFVLVSSEIERIDSEGNSLSRSRKAVEPGLIEWYLSFINYIGGHSQVMFRRDVVLALRGYSEVYRYAQDYELWSRLAKVGKICILPEVLLKYRIHTQSISTKSRTSQQQSYLVIAKQNLEILLDRDMSLEEAHYFCRFWLAGGSLSIRDLNTLQRKLQVLLDAFLEKQPQGKFAKYELASQIKLSICKRFLFWAETARDKPFERILFLYQAFKWDPKEIFSCTLGKRFENVWILRGLKLNFY